MSVSHLHYEYSKSNGARNHEMGVHGAGIKAAGG
jgi:hypothetical protein